MSSFKKPQPNLGFIPKPKEKIMKTFELELEKSLPGLDISDFYEAIHTAGFEEYGLEYSNCELAAWEEQKHPKVRLIVEYDTK